MATDIWFDGTANWDTPSDWSAGVPVPSSDVIIDIGNPQVTASFGIVASIEDAASLIFIDAGASSVTGGVTIANSGTLALDPFAGDGGSSLAIGGALDNSGLLLIGPGDNSSSASSIIDAASVANTTHGTIALNGLAILDVSSAAGLGAAGILYGAVDLSGDALLEFASGQITTIAANSELNLNGPHTFVADAGDLTSNSALTGLAEVTGGLNLYNGATVTTGALFNRGTITLDQSHGDGGASLVVGGALTNTGTVSIGPSDDSLAAASVISASNIINFKGTTYGTIDVYGNDSPSLAQPIPATLNISGPAGFGKTGRVEGNVNVAYDGQIVFGSGEITTIAANSELSLTAKDAIVADAGSLSSSSALTGLKSVVGSLYLQNGATVTTSAGLSNSGTISLDQYTNNGGSSLTVGGALTNTGTVSIGSAENSLPAASVISASRIINFKGTTYGTIDVYGNDSSSAHPVPATLDISGPAGFGVAGTVEGKVNIAFDGQIVFGSGEITTIAANSELSLTDKDAVVADKSNMSSNSALEGLSAIDGSLYLNNGARVTTTGALTNSGTISLDQYTNDGGSSLTVGGALTNTGTISIGPSNDTLSAMDTVQASSLTNKGTIDAYGDGTKHAKLSIAGPVTNDGSINFSDDAETFDGRVSGTGHFSLSNGSNLHFAGGVSSGETISFGGGAADLLSLHAGSSFHDTIKTFFTPGDGVDLTNFAFAATMAAYTQTGPDSASWTLTDGANQAVINFVGEPYAKSDFSIVSANAGKGTEIKFV